MRRKVLSEPLRRHLERGEEELRRSREVGERHATAFERLMSAFDRLEARWDEDEGRWEEREERWEEREKSFNKRLDENEQFMWELNRRSERVVQNLLRGNQEFCRELNSKVDEKTEAIMAELKEGREESRAHRKALLALIDRLPPPQAGLGGS